MNVEDFTYTELNKMYCDLIEQHSKVTELNDPDDTVTVPMDAFDDLAEKVDGLKDVFDWSFGIEGNSYDVGLIHRDRSFVDEKKGTIRNAMIRAECSRRKVDMESVREFVRICNELKCVRI